MVRNILSGGRSFAGCLLIVLAAGLALGFFWYVTCFSLHSKTLTISEEPVATPSLQGLPDTGGGLHSYPIPPGLDTTDTPLEFRWDAGPVTSSESPAQIQGLLSVSVDGLAVGKYPLDSFPLSCQRSEDGSKIGFLTRLPGTASNQYLLIWIDLSTPGKTNPVVILDRPDVTYAFDPGWKNLAYTICDSSQVDCPIDLLNLDTHHIANIPHAGQVKAIQWSPVGDALGFITLPPEGKPAMLGILDLKTGNLEYHLLSDLPALTQFAQSAAGPDQLSSLWENQSLNSCTLALQNLK